MNVVALIARRFQTDVCSAYLLEPDRANLVLAATVGLRPQCIGTLRMALTKGWPAWWPSRSAGRRRAGQEPSALQIFQRSGRRCLPIVLGVPLIDRGVLQGVLVVQTIEPRAFTDDEIRMLVEAAAQVAPVVSEARTLDRFIAPAQERLWALARNLWWSWDHDSTSLFRDLDPVRWRQLNHNPIALLSRNPAGEARTPRRRTGAAQPHQLRLPPPAGISASGPHLGRDARRRSAAAAGGLFFRRVRPARIHSRFIPAAWACWPATTSRARPISTFRWSASACFTARAISASGWTATAGSRKNTCRPTSTSCPWSRRSARTASRSTSRSRRAAASIRAKVWRVKVGRCDLLLLDSNVEGNAPEDRELTSRLYGGDGRVRIRQELLLGVGGFRALKAMGITPGVLHLNEGHSGFAVLEAIRSRMEEEGLGFDQAVPRVSREVVFTTHTPVPAGHDRFQCRADRGASRAAARSAGPLARDAHGAWARELRQLRRRVLHDRAGPEAFAPRQRRFGSARRSFARHVDRALSRQARKTQFPSATSPTACTCPPGWRRRCSGLYDRHLGTGWHEHSGEARIWEGIENVDDGELWETHLSLKSRLLEFVRRRAVEQAERRGEVRRRPCRG